MFSSNILLKVLRKPTIVVPTKWKSAVRRNIVHVYTKEEYEQELLSKSEKKSKLIKKTTKLKVPKVTKPKDADIVKTSLLQLKYKKLRDLPGNAFYQMVYNMKTSTYRQAHKLCLLIGAQLIQEALKEGSFVKSIYFNRLHKLDVFSSDAIKKVHLTHIADRSLKAFPKRKLDGLFAIASTQDAKIRLKIIDKRRADERSKKLRILPISVVCNGIQDSVEMGAILKMANEACCEQVYIIDGCVDAWSLDALQAGQGAHFKIPITQNISWEKLQRLKGSQNVFVLHHSHTGISVNDFFTEKNVRRQQDVLRIVQMLEKESTLGSIFKNDESIVTIPSVPLHEVNLIHPSLLCVGSVDFDAFQFLSFAKSTKQICAVVNVPVDEASTTLQQTDFILKEAKQQVDAKRQDKS